MKTRQIRVVAVVEASNEGGGICLTCFKDNLDGNRAAEKLFIKKCKENGLDDGDKELASQALKNGFFPNIGGEYSVSIVHSDIEEGG